MTNTDSNTSTTGPNGELPQLLSRLAEQSVVDHSGNGNTRRRDRLLRAAAETVVAKPSSAVDAEQFEAFVGAVTPGLDIATKRVVSEALFVAADSRPDAIVQEIGTVRSLLETDDPVVAAWSAGVFGRVAETHAEAVAPAATDLAALLDSGSQTVQHNVVEALATLAQKRPEAVAPATDAVRPLLDHSDTAIQHNATGILGVLAATHPEAVLPAVGTLRTLTDHDDQAVRGVAAGTLRRLTRQHPGIVGDGPD